MWTVVAIKEKTLETNEKYKKKLYIKDMGDSTTLIIYPPKLAKEYVTEEISIILNAIEGKVKQVKELVASQQSPLQTPSSSSNGVTYRSVLYIDGEVRTLNAVRETMDRHESNTDPDRVYEINEDSDSSEGNDHVDTVVQDIGNRTPTNLTVIKLPAATSMMTQPNDVMKRFVILKQRLKQKMNEPDSSTEHHTKPACYEHIVASLRSHHIFSVEDRKTICLIIEYAQETLYKAYIPTTVKSGWEKTGIYPLDMNVMLGHWPAYLLTENKRKVELHEAFDLLAGDLQMNDHGYLTEEELYYRLNTFMTPEEFSVNMGDHNRKPLNEKLLNVQRCVILNNERFRSHEKNRVIRKNEEAAAKQKVKNEKFLNAERKKTENAMKKVAKEEAKAAAAAKREAKATNEMRMKEDKEN